MAHTSAREDVHGSLPSVVPSDTEAEDAPQEPPPDPTLPPPPGCVHIYEPMAPVYIVKPVAPVYVYGSPANVYVDGNQEHGGPPGFMPHSYVNRWVPDPGYIPRYGQNSNIGSESEISRHGRQSSSLADDELTTDSESSDRPTRTQESPARPMSRRQRDNLIGLNPSSSSSEHNLTSPGFTGRITNLVGVTHAGRGSGRESLTSSSSEEQLYSLRNRINQVQSSIADLTEEMFNLQIQAARVLQHPIPGAVLNHPRASGTRRHYSEPVQILRSRLARDSRNATRAPYRQPGRVVRERGRVTGEIMQQEQGPESLPLFQFSNNSSQIDLSDMRDTSATRMTSTSLQRVRSNSF